MARTELSLSKQPDLSIINTSSIMETKIRLSLLLLEISVLESSRLEKLIKARDYAESQIFDEGSLRAYSVSDLKELYPVINSSISDAKSSVQSTVANFNPQDIVTQIDLLKTLSRQQDSLKDTLEDEENRSNASDIARELLSQMMRDDKK